MAELKIVRILVSVQAAEPEAGAGAAGGVKKSWQVTFTGPDGRAGWSLSRRMVGEAVGAHHFPRPHPDEPDLPSPSEPHHALCLGTDLEPLRQIYRGIVNRSLSAAEKHVSTFGKYLFDTLVGEENWQAIIALAQEEDADLLELALAWESGEIDLHRLNWELMHGPESFLAALRAEPPRQVAITRVVKGADWKPVEMRPIPRCLFVIGTDLNDPEIRPGAEYLGLLRQIDRSGRAIHSRVVRTARLKPRDPERIVKAFSPDLVYLIAHGQFDGRGGAELELRLDAQEEDYQRLRNPEAVFNLLAEGERLPAMAVLSACNTGQSSGRVEIKGAHETAPMAAYLVARGIPVVIGMAGEVADGACRHFTRRFGEAIVRGESLVAATAEGRRAAFAHDPTGEKSADWAFPAVFMSAAVELGWVPSPRDSGSAPPIEKWVDCYHKHRRAEPVFCGRHEFFDAYYDLFDRNRPSTLGAYVVPRSRLDRENLPGGEDEQGSRGYGKTRLLKELAVQAIHDGHIPIVVTSDGEDWAPPNTVPALVNELYKALNRATDAYGVEVAAGQVEAVKDQLHGIAAQLNAQVTRVFKEENYSVTARVISAALTTDMTQLIEKAHAKPEHEFLRKMAGSAILFLDEVESYEEEFVSKLFDGALLGAGGLRPESALPANESEPWDAAKTILPVVMTLTTEGAPNTILKAIRERGNSLAWLRLEQLTRFDFPAQPDKKRQKLPAALLAYEHVLLNPFDKNAQLRRDVSNKAYALDHKVDDDKWEFWYTMLWDEYGGLPIYFTSKGCFRTVQIISRPNEFLIEANDEELLRRHEQGPGPGGEPSGGGTT